MNAPRPFPYKGLMKNLFIIILVMAAAGFARADINASWPARNKHAGLAELERNKVKYVSISDAAKFLDSENDVNVRRGTGIMRLTNGDLNYTIFSPYIMVGDKSYNIRYDVIFHDGDFYAPIEYLALVIDRLLPENFVYLPAENLIRITPTAYNIKELTAQQKLNGLLIEVLITEELKFDVVKTDDYWLIITLYGGQIDTSFFNGRRPVKAIYDTKAYQFDNSAQLSVRLRPKDFTFVSKLRENPLRIQVMVKGEGFADTVLAYAPEQGHMRDNKIDVIVIDPGHGGDDLGAVGPSGTKEKDINLQVSKKLQSILEDRGFDVILSRDSDRFVSLADRTRIANEAGADIFISIHANSSERNKKARGYISFFLSDAKTDQARAAAALENSSIQFETPESRKDYVSDIDFILLDMVQSEFLQESSELAAMIEQNIQNQTAIESRGVDQAGFFVLNKAYMPSVLVETAFISNKDDEKLLKNGKVQQDIAVAIADAITSFKAKYEAMSDQ